MIVDDSRWKFGENHSMIDYHAPFDQGFQSLAKRYMIVDDSW